MTGRRLDRVDPGGVVWDAIGPQRAIGGVVNSACTVVEPGVIEVANAKSRITLGEPDGTISARAKALAAALEAGGMGSEAVPDIRSRIWAKLMLNICSGPLGVLTQAGNPAIYADPALCDTVRTDRGGDDRAGACHGLPGGCQPGGSRSRTGARCGIRRASCRICSSAARWRSTRCSPSPSSSRVLPASRRPPWTCWWRSRGCARARPACMAARLGTARARGTARLRAASPRPAPGAARGSAGRPGCR